MLERGLNDFFSMSYQFCGAGPIKWVALPVQVHSLIKYDFLGDENKLVKC